MIMRWNAISAFIRCKCAQMPQSEWILSLTQHWKLMLGDC